VSHWYVAFGFCFLKIYITLQNKDSWYVWKIEAIATYRWHLSKNDLEEKWILLHYIKK
jgi:hypothetical protein